MIDLLLIQPTKPESFFSPASPFPIETIDFHLVIDITLPPSPVQSSSTSCSRSSPSRTGFNYFVSTPDCEPFPCPRHLFVPFSLCLFALFAPTRPRLPVEIIAYLNRSVFHYRDQSLGLYAISSIVALIAPALFAAIVYMTFSRIIRLLNEAHHSLVNFKISPTSSLCACRGLQAFKAEKSQHTS